MLVTMPHWATLLVAAIGVCAGALVGVFPAYAAALGGVSAICTALSAPHLTKTTPEEKAAVLEAHSARPGPDGGK